MARFATSLFLLAAMCASAAADRVVLTDGRSFTGAVTIRDDLIEVRLPYGTIQLARHDVLRIERTDTVESQLALMLDRTDQNDPDALCVVADWARQNGLPGKAVELCEAAVAIDPEHALAHKGLEHVNIDGAWMPFDQAMERTRSKLAAGRQDSLLAEVFPQLEETAATSKDLQTVGQLKCEAQLRARRFAEARRAYETLAARAEPPAASRFAAVAEILAANADGMYVLTEPFPPAAALLGDAENVVPAGPASLADPRVMEAALRDRAKKHVDAGRALLKEAAQAEPLDPEAARAKYAQAARAFDQADALVPEIARSYRLEIARRKITAVRQDIEGDSASFDREMAQLGQSDLSAPAYRNKIVKMMHSLDGVRKGLQNVLEIAGAYPRELVLEIKWADLDLQRVRQMRDILAAELDGAK